jgi:uncharacterized protein
MDAAALMGVMDFFIDLFSRRGEERLDVTFFGGEPLLEADQILRVIDHYGAVAGNGLPLAYTVCTNGTLLSEDLLAELSGSGVSILVSLDGDAETHDLNRSLPDGTGSHALIAPYIPGLVLRKAGVEKVIACNTVDRTARSVRWLVERGFRTILCVPDFSGSWTRELLDGLRAQYEEIADLYLELWRAGVPFSFSPFDDKVLLAATGKSYKDACCNMGKMSFVVDPGLDIYPCTRFARVSADKEYRIGTIASGLDAAAMERLFACHSRDKAPCLGCSLAPRCLGNNCGCIAYSLKGDIGYVSPLVCEHERMLIPIADRVGSKARPGKGAGPR